MDSTYIWSVIFVTGIVTYIPRLLPFVLLSKTTLPEWFKVWLRFVPTSVFGAMIFSEIFVRSNGLNLAINNISLLASLFVFAVAMKTKSLGISIGTGFAAFWLLQNQSFINVSF